MKRAKVLLAVLGLRPRVSRALFSAIQDELALIDENESPQVNGHGGSTSSDGGN